MAEHFVLLPEWDDWRGDGRQPSHVGPFDTREEADEWARLNVPNGSWQVAPLTWPYLRSGGSDRG